jgi:hypothetical protein
LADTHSSISGTCPNGAARGEPTRAPMPDGNGPGSYALRQFGHSWRLSGWQPKIEIDRRNLRLYIVT